MNSSTDFSEMKQFLDNRVLQYNSIDFIDSDPIQIPHLFSGKEDIEISAFLTATIAWRQRKSIINNANKLMEWMDNLSYQFLIDADNSDWKRIFEVINFFYFQSKLHFSKLKLFIECKLGLYWGTVSVHCISVNEGRYALHQALPWQQCHYRLKVEFSF